METKNYKIAYTFGEEKIFSINVVVVEDDKYYYVDFLTGLGAGAYDKDDWSLDEALRDQAHIREENPDASGDSWCETEDFDFNFDDYDYRKNL